MQQHRSSSIERDIQQCTIPFMIMPSNEQAPAICGPVYVRQSVPSFHHQLTRFARGCGPELDRSLVGTVRDDGSLRTIGGQAPIRRGIDLRGFYASPALHVESVRFVSISLGDGVEASRGRQARTLHVRDADVFENQASSSAGYRSGENGQGCLGVGELRSRNI